jgi:hypothetical protein
VIDRSWPTRRALEWAYHRSPQIFVQVIRESIWKRRGQPQRARGPKTGRQPPGSKVSKQGQERGRKTGGQPQGSKANKERQVRDPKTRGHPQGSRASKQGQERGHTGPGPRTHATAPLLKPRQPAQTPRVTVEVAPKPPCQKTKSAKSQATLQGQMPQGKTSQIQPVVLNNLSICKTEDSHTHTSRKPKRNSRALPKPSMGPHASGADKQPVEQKPNPGRRNRRTNKRAGGPNTLGSGPLLTHPSDPNTPRKDLPRRQQNATGVSASTKNPPTKQQQQQQPPRVPKPSGTNQQDRSRGPRVRGGSKNGQQLRDSREQKQRRQEGQTSKRSTGGGPRN